MSRLFFITHAEVDIDPAVPVPEWGLSETGAARHAGFAKRAPEFCAIWSSTERKAREGAAFLADAQNLSVQSDPELGENDRSATGFLPPDVFEKAADAFFEYPDISYKGWETAIAAQTRVVSALQRIVSASPKGDVAVVAHGAVGALTRAWAMGSQISRAHDQIGSCGNVMVLARPDLAFVRGWTPMEQVFTS